MNNQSLNWSDDIKYLSSNAVKIPESGGLYKVLRNDGENGKLTRVYLGKAENLRSQFNYHLSDSEENECLKRNVHNKECYFKYALLSGEDNRQNAASARGIWIHRNKKVVFIVSFIN